MPAVSVSVDGFLKARVCTDGLDVLSVNIGGTKIEDAFATVEFSGGAYPEDGDSTHLIWLNELELEVGQSVRVEVAAAGSNSHQGKTIEQLFPEPYQEKHGPMPSRKQLVEGVKLRKHTWEHFTLSVRSSSGANACAEVGLGDHGFGASFLWNWQRPERVSASLHTYSLDQLASEEGFSYNFREVLQPGAWAEVRVDA